MKLIIQDYAMGAIIALNEGARFITNYIQTSIPALQSTAKALETNPAGKYTTGAYFTSFILTIAAYGVLIAIYIYNRDRLRKSPERRVVLNGFVLILFLLALTDFVNDAGIIAGLVLK